MYKDIHAHTHTHTNIHRKFLTVARKFLTVARKFLTVARYRGRVPGGVSRVASEVRVTLAGRVATVDVTERFRDCSPGQFVYGRSGVFERHGLHRLVAAPELARWTDYLARVGFRPDGGTWVRDVAAA